MTTNVWSDRVRSMLLGRRTDGGDWRMGILRRTAWMTLAALRGRTVEYLGQLESWQWLDAEKVHDLQHRRLERLLLHAHRHTSWYREVLDTSNVIKGGEAHLDSFEEIPLLSKSDIREYGARMLSDDLESRHRTENTSGGSTGEPVRLLQDRDYEDWNRAVKLLHDLWTDCRVGDRRARLWGSERDLWRGHEDAAVRFRRWLGNERWLNTFRMTEGQAREHVRALNRFRPRQVMGYVESLYDMSRLIEREQLRIHAPRSVVSTGGTLYPEMRCAIESAFGAPVFNRYGSREVGDVACECERHSGLHVSPLTHYVEILRPDGSRTAPGEIGEIVVTSLTNEAMPLIRYRIGDSGRWSETMCPCGRGWSTLDAVTGRVIDIFESPDGSRVHGQYFIHLFYFRDWVAKFRVVQESLGHIRVLLTTTQEFKTPAEAFRSELEDIARKIRWVMGEDCRVDFEFMREIPPSPSGKYRYTISKVARSENVGA